MISQIHLDDLAASARHGAGNAGSMLSRWLHREVRIEVCSVASVRLDLIPQEGEDAGATTITIASRVNGGLPGNAAVQLSYADATQLVVCLGGKLPGEEQAGGIGEMERSMLQETANILFSSMMNGMASRMDIVAVPLAPVVLVDVGTAAWDALLESAACADDAVVVTARIACIGSGPTIHLVFLPSPEVLHAITRGAGHD